ncbi:reverse transcriptase domain-containing protein [Artemisia annua]|uniref:Reverse transcriptase domain-containing protein n=1 Tax=Artemisia annua TaxID=35608 RepID=A0A2U1MBY1_ARTAN|nr:reverse transcriptase domain-containing protein [Artemisia annua]
MEAETAFQRWKECMEILPTVKAPARGEILLLHVATSFDEVGAMLFAEKRNVQIQIYFIKRNVQIQIYFISRVLTEVERSYVESEKLILAMVYATRCFRRYFKDHPIRVLTDKPVKWVSLKPDRSKLMVKWAIELEEYDIEYGINGLFEGQTNEPAEVGESNMSSNKRTFKAKIEEKHHVGDLKMRMTSNNQKSKCLDESSFKSGVKQQASTK